MHHWEVQPPAGPVPPAACLDALAALAPDHSLGLAAVVAGHRLQGKQHPRTRVGYLAAEACTDSGRIFSVGGGYIARVAIVEGAGATFSEGFSPDDVAASWNDVMNVGITDGAAEFTSGVMEQTGKIVTALGISFE